MRQQQFVGRTAHHDCILAGHAVDLGVGHNVAQGGLHVVQVGLLPGVGQIESLHRLFIEIGALGAVVLGHEDRIGGHRAPESVGQGAHDAQRVHQRHVVQVHLNALRGKVRIEQDVHPGGSADGLVHHLGVFGHVQGQRLV